VPLSFPRSTTRERLGSRVTSWLARPVSLWGCVIGWIVATAVYVTICTIVGMSTEGDARVSVFIGWALAHGHFACGYPPGSISRNLAAPIYPLISGAASAIFRIGHGVTFPSNASLGPHCATAYAAMDQWAQRSHAWTATLRAGYVGWLALAAGSVALLRSSGRGRTRWEPTALILLALTPTVSMCLVEYFHPQDLLALGLSLGALACVVRGRWALAGALIGLALVTQQYSLLVLAPLVVLAPRSRRSEFLASLIAAVVLVALPVIAFSDGRAIKSIVLGTGGQLYSFSLFDETGLRAPLLFVLARFLPLAAALVVAWWAQERLGDRALEAGTLLSLVTVCLCLRLVFEVNVLGYYFMAVAATLLIGDVLRGRLRVSLVLWLAAVTVVTLNVFDTNASFHAVVVWQVVLVAGALALALGPLVKRTRRVSATGPVTSTRSD